MRAAEVMTKDVQTITPERSAADAYEVMRRNGIRHVVVMDDSSVAGVLSDRDTGGRAGEIVRANARVGDLMSRTVERPLRRGRWAADREVRFGGTRTADVAVARARV